jgi:spermidine/putrescine transport system permease protein
MRKRSYAYSSRRSGFSRFMFAAVCVFLIGPLLVPILFSFNVDKSLDFSHVSLKWYAQLFDMSMMQSNQIWSGFWTSIEIAFLSALIATVVGTLAAIGMRWYSFRMKRYLQVLSFVPLVLPEIIMGISFACFFTQLMGLTLGFGTLLLSHVTFNLPFVYLLVSARLDEFDFSIVEAARDLGASEVQTLTRVIVPISTPGIVSGFITAFTLSLDDFMISWFVKGTSIQTLPIVTFTQATKRGEPMIILALSSVLILGTVVIAILARNMLKNVAAK